MGAAPSSALAIAVVPYAPDAKQEQLLLQLLAGANSVLQAAGCPLVGGHTGEGPEVSLGAMRCGCPAAAAAGGWLPHAGGWVVLVRHCVQVPCQVTLPWLHAHAPVQVPCQTTLALPCLHAHAGFCINGHAPRGSLLTKGGLQAGQVLLLTKPLGTGTIMAAAMRGMQPGSCPAAALHACGHSAECAGSHQTWQTAHLAAA
jgi:thiamine monophosphate kinase